MSDRTTVELLFTLVLAVTFFTVLLYWKASVWSECRAQGNSVLYCLQLVRR